MLKIQHHTGAIEYIQAEDEIDVNEKMKATKEKLKNTKKGSDLSNADIADLVYAIAKHLKII